MSRPITISIDDLPDGSNDLVADDVVVVAFRRTDRSVETFQTFQPRPDRRIMLNAAKALLAELAEDERDIYGKAAARALERVHRKL
jgi:hypothetical protein